MKKRSTADLSKHNRTQQSITKHCKAQRERTKPLTATQKNWWPWKRELNRGTYTEYVNVVHGDTETCLPGDFSVASACRLWMYSALVQSSLFDLSVSRLPHKRVVCGRREVYCNLSVVLSLNMWRSHQALLYFA